MVAIICEYQLVYVPAFIYVSGPLFHVECLFLDVSCALGIAGWNGIKHMVLLRLCFRSKVLDYCTGSFLLTLAESTFSFGR